MIRLAIWGIVVMGSGIIWAAFDGLGQGADSATWPSVAGTIVVSRVENRISPFKGGPSYAPYSVILYRWRVNGIDHTGSRLSYDMSVSDYGPSLSTDYPVGKPVRVYYDPANPDEGVLFPGAMTRGQAAGMAIMGGALAGLGIWALRNTKN